MLVEYKKNELFLCKFEMLQRLCRRVNKNGDLFKNQLVLNIGAGTGLESYLILLESPRTLILLDNNTERLNIARDYLSNFNNKKLLFADAHNLPFKDRSLDLVTITDALHHIDDPYQAIREAQRVAKRYVILDDARKGKVRDFLKSISVKFFHCQEYEIDERNHVCKFRIDLDHLEYVFGHKYKIHYFAYFTYSFNEWYSKTGHRFIKKIYLLIVIAINSVFHAFGNRVIVIMSQRPLKG